MKRMLSTGLKHIIIGVSGGLDSTHALIVAAKTIDRLGLPRESILGYTMPGFATSDITLKNAHALMRALGNQRKRDRHSAELHADAERPWPSVQQRRTRL